MASSITGHTILCAWLYWRKPLAVGKSVQILIYSSWYAWVANALGLMLGLWEFTSPVLGTFGTMLSYNVILFPIKVLTLILAVGASWRLSALVFLLLSASCVAGEALALKYSTLLIYHRPWNLYLTFGAFCLTYGVFWYIFRDCRRQPRSLYKLG